MEGYAVERRIGRGGSATVYLARELKHNRQVAVKVLDPSLVESIQGERFLREIEIIAALAHPNILPLLDSGRSGDVLYYAMPYVPGQSLRALLERAGPLPIPQAIRIVAEAADALDYAHRQGVVHRDVKPENILVADGHALVADFGIARALSLSTDDRITTAGVAPGTPRYMSPEQAGGALELDGRSDVYSLACVMYELASGAPPFRGETPQAVAVQHMTAPVPSLRDGERGIPSVVDQAVTRAMAKQPQDRFATAADFAAALRRGLTGEGQAAGMVLRWTAPGRETARRRLLLGTAAIVVLGYAALQWTGGGGPTPPLRGDTTLVVVLPIEGAVQADGLDYDLLYDAIARWSDLRLLDPFQIGDAIRRFGAPLGSREAAVLASSLGAGRYVRAQLAPRGESRRVTAALYDVGQPQPLHTASQTVPADLAAATEAYARLADSLLLRGADVDSPRTETGRRSLPAVQAFSRAQRALDAWDLASADSAFQLAVGFDPEYARASLWLAQVRVWRGEPRGTWSTLAQRARELPGQLSERERMLGEAIELLGVGRYEAACEVYDRLRRENERDFAAWFGLGQCQSLNNLVVLDARSPSGWSLRTSARAAMAAFQRAFEILPSVHRGYERGAFERLKVLLLVTTQLKTAYGAADSALFFARPGWMGDTLVLVPYPWQVVAAGGSDAFPPGFHEALNQRRAEFRRIAAGWSAAFPRSGEAKQAVALALELMGDPSAIDTLQHARSLAQDPSRRTQLAAMEVVLLVKFGVPDDLEKLRTARALAESLLVQTPATPDAAELLSAVAAFSGRCDRAEQLARRAVPGPYLRIPADLLADAEGLLARVAIGCPVIPPTRTMAAIHAAIRREFPSEEERRRVEETLLLRPVLLAETVDAPVLGTLATSTRNALLVAARALLQGDSLAARSSLEAFEARPEIGAPTPDMALARARLWRRLGDEARAASALDGALLAARTYDTNALSLAATAAAFVRAIVFRADLAASAGDSVAARRWAEAAVALWSGADRHLQPVLDRMEGYARSR